MKAVKSNKKPKGYSGAVNATHLPTISVTYQLPNTAPSTQQQLHNYSKVEMPPPPEEPEPPPSIGLPTTHLPSDVEIGLDDNAPAYSSTLPCDEKGAKQIRQSVAHMEELKSQEAVFLQILLSLHHDSRVLTPCSCGIGQRLRTVGCADCLQAELLCPQCWLDKHRTMPTHWALVWNAQDQFFEKKDFCLVMKNAAVSLGHSGKRCPNAHTAKLFRLVDTNGIHATSLAFCGCRTPHGEAGEPEFQQLLRAGIFPGSVKSPQTGYTLPLLEYYRQLRNQGKGSAYNFVLVLQRLSDPFFADGVPDIYTNFLAITRFHQDLDITMRRGYAHGIDQALPGETHRAYPNRPVGFLGLQCAACPERGVNMPLVVHIPRYLRHLVSLYLTLDGNFKANLFFKRDNGSDVALTDGKMYFPVDSEFKRIADEYLSKEEDKQAMCNTHIGSIRHQGKMKYGNTAISGVVASACDHAVVGSLVDMPVGESSSPWALSYDSWCSWKVHALERAKELFPDETWLHEWLENIEGQIPADHINGHGVDCQTLWQAVYFACRAHFHGETAEVVWAFLNPLGSSTRQSTSAARHDIMNFVIDAWNALKYMRHAELLANERVDALRLFELHMAVLENLSRQHATEVPACKTHSIILAVLTIENTLASMIATERERLRGIDHNVEGQTSIAEWLYDGMKIQREEVFLIALLKHHHSHPLKDTWEAIDNKRKTLNIDLKSFRERQRTIYPHLKLSALDVEEPELTAIQLPSYRMKHGQRPASSVDVSEIDRELRDTEIELRCAEAESGILAVQAASMGLSAVKRMRDDDYRGQMGKTRSKRNVEKAELVKTFEIEMYNKARQALIYLGYMEEDADSPYRAMTGADTWRKETHLHRATGDSRLFDGTAWYLQSGTTISGAELTSAVPLDPASADDEEQDTARLKLVVSSAAPAHSPRKTKRLKDIAPENVQVDGLASEAEGSDEVLPSANGKAPQNRKKKKKKQDGWIWLEYATRGQKLGDEGKLADYKKESDRVQWFRAEAEMFRWLEQYERKHAEFMRIMQRYRRDGEVWQKLAERAEFENGGPDGSATFARMQAAMHKRLEHNATEIFRSAELGAHQDWVKAVSFEELVQKIDSWRDRVFKWMDDMDIHRAYKDF
ncbi:CxC2 domain-containing protein [Favolaschia claudopus]|uniref:CxC2 domain-containing protein n=1 Tax=Favolaschia claudopus TaxID=2862362 RepID=A0AAV9Z5Q8_9AGAR